MVRTPPIAIHAEVTALSLEGAREAVPDLRAALAHLVSQARKKNVDRVHATLEITPALVLRLELFERGARIKVPGRGLYAGTVDGLLNAIADVIREEHASDPALLDVYGRLLSA